MLCTFKIVKPSSTISCSFLKFPNRCPSGNDESVIISSNKSVVSINLKNQVIYLLQLTRTLWFKNQSQDDYSHLQGKVTILKLKLHFATISQNSLYQLSQMFLVKIYIITTNKHVSGKSSKFTQFKISNVFSFIHRFTPCSSLSISNVTSSYYLLRFLPCPYFRSKKFQIRVCLTL